MGQPLGYIVQEENKVCHLKKTIYGLKQSLRAWFENFSRIVMRAGFWRCVVDHSVCIQQGNNGCEILAIYIDDILLTHSGTNGIVETKECLRRQFVLGANKAY